MEISREEFLNIKYITSTQEERETIVTMTVDGPSVYTTDTVWLHKLQKLILRSPGLIKSISQTRNRDGEVTSIDCDMDDDLFLINLKAKKHLEGEELERMRERASLMRMNRA